MFLKVSFNTSSQTTQQERKKVLLRLQMTDSPVHKFLFRSSLSTQPLIKSALAFGVLSSQGQEF